jgi:VWFA-related protein
LALLLVAVVILLTQTRFTAIAAQSQQPVPDAPSASRPAQPLPSVPAGARNAPEPPPSPSNAPDSSSKTAPPPANDSAPPAPAPARPAGTTVPRPRNADDQSRNDLFTLVSRVNFVVVPVTVKDPAGRLVDGLLRRDFAVLEDGVPQPLQLFTSDPFPLSAAVVVDTGMPDNVLKKVQDTLPAIAGAFGPNDEVAFYSYGNSVDQVSDFVNTPDAMTAGIRNMVEANIAGEVRKRRQGAPSTVPFYGGPLNQQSPSVNGRNVDPNAPIVPIVQTPSRVLNDAVLRAARDLGRRERTRRKLLFVITDGVNSGSRARYQDVLKVLLTNDITVYGLGVGQASLPVYRELQKVHVPYAASNELLPKYASATGGEMLDAFEKKSIEQAYARTTLEARNQYTLGYTTRATGATNYREIEVRVHRPNLKVVSKAGYYPLPPEKPVTPSPQ